ncbi:MAG: glucosamine-6-phosphate deaminase [Termitinemataceae bacterium]|nr:MAG: glucosamine-6-phosphate deaminase [Termitinemataceae bacterium]
MRLIIKKNYDEASAFAAKHIVDRINSSHKKPFVLGLATGSSPIGIYKELVAMYKAGKISFKDVVTFNMDEYVNIPENHPQSYHTFMAENFFNHVDLPKQNQNILNGNAKDLSIECAEYENRIRQAGGVELFLGGIGEDGHIAFNEPGSSLVSRTREKTLTQDTRVANSRFFENDINKVPKTALSVGVGTVMASNEVLIIATGIKKARALHHVIENGINHLWTLSCLQMHSKAMIVCDEDATMELKVGTVRYFKDIEGIN